MNQRRSHSAKITSKQKLVLKLVHLKLIMIFNMLFYIFMVTFLLSPSMYALYPSDIIEYRNVNTLFRIR